MKLGTLFLHQNRTQKSSTPYGSDGHYGAYGSSYGQSHGHYGQSYGGYGRSVSTN